MGRVMVVYEEGVPESYLPLIDAIKEYFVRSGFHVEVFYIEEGMAYDKCQEKYDDPNWDYICTLDMAGFQILTILGEPRYNIMPAKQIHIVVNEEIFALYQDMQFALNLYMFLPVTMHGENLNQIYIPNVTYYEPFSLKEDSAGDKGKLIGMLESVREECETLCG